MRDRNDIADPGPFLVCRDQRHRTKIGIAHRASIAVVVHSHDRLRIRSERDPQPTLSVERAHPGEDRMNAQPPIPEPGTAAPEVDAGSGAPSAVDAPAASFSHRTTGPSKGRVGLVAGAALVLVAVAAATSMAASPAPSTSPSTNGPSVAAPNGQADKDGLGRFGGPNSGRAPSATSRSPRSAATTLRWRRRTVGAARSRSRARSSSRAAARRSRSATSRSATRSASARRATRMGRSRSPISRSSSRRSAARSAARRRAASRSRPATVRSGR